MIKDKKGIPKANIIIQILDYLYAFSEDFIVKPIKFKILIKESPKRIIVPKKLNNATGPFSMSKSKMKIIDVTKNVGMKNINISARTIPEK
jgi:hypothetical protein